MAPEAILKEKIDEKSDVWSLGVTFYEMLFGNLPWTKLKQNEEI
jgi:serine/threonine-protein kinase ULK/ATG1